MSTKVKLLLNKRHRNIIDSDEEDYSSLDDFSLQSNTAQSTVDLNYNYPKTLYEKVFPSISKDPESKFAGFKNVLQNLNLPEALCNHNNSIITLCIDQSETKKSKPKVASIELQTSIQSGISKVDSQKGNRRNTPEQLALEDWLDQVL